MPYLIEQGFSRGDLGFALSGISIAYGFSKFIMGSVSDRSNPRIFTGRPDPCRAGDAGDGLRPTGDLQHYGDVRPAVPVRLVPGDGLAAVRTYDGALVVAEERGGIVSVWNCAHNVGGGIPPLLFLLGMAWFNDWHAALYMPAFGAILLAIFAFAMMRDTPQSCGLPPIEEYKTIILTTTARSTKKS